MTALRDVRVTRLLSIRGLADLAGVAPSTVYLIEAGRTTPRFSVMRRLAAALDIEPAAVDEFRHAVEAAQEPPKAARRRSDE